MIARELAHKHARSRARPVPPLFYYSFTESASIQNSKMQPVTQYARQAVAASCRASAAAVTVRRFSAGWLTVPMRCASPQRCVHIDAGAAKKSIKVTFVKPDGSKQVVDAPIGDSMLEVAHANSIDIEGKPCRATIVSFNEEHHFVVPASDFPDTEFVEPHDKVL